MIHKHSKSRKSDNKARREGFELRCESARRKRKRISFTLRRFELQLVLVEKRKE